MDAPQITVADLQDLAAGTSQDPVLYLDAESGELEVWDSAYVNSGHQVLTLTEMRDVLGDDPDWDDVDEYLDSVQRHIDEMVDQRATR